MALKNAPEALEIAWWPVSRPVPYGRNARKIPQAAVEKVARSLQDFGWRQPIVVDAQEVIIAGHTRLAAAIWLGWKTCPVHVAAGLTPEQVKAYRLADNRTHDETAWDPGSLALELKDLAALGVDLAATAFDGLEIDRLLSGGAPDDEKANTAPALPAIASSELGDLWLLGPHRLICGDSTDPATVARVLESAERPRLMVTDPPYGVEYDPNWRAGEGQFTAALVQTGEVDNDDRADWSTAYRLFPGDVAYVWHAGLRTIDAGIGLQKAGFIIRAVIIWRKQQIVMSRGHYHWQHEPAWYAVRKGRGAGWRGDRKQSTVWDVANLNPTGHSSETRTGHGTQKPAELMKRPMLNHTERGETVYDPFVGSGTTIMAAELCSRVCLAVELDPRYVDVCIKRWQDYTGLAARHSNGRTFAEIAQERAAAAPAETASS